MEEDVGDKVSSSMWESPVINQQKKITDEVIPFSLKEDLVEHVWSSIGRSNS